MVLNKIWVSYAVLNFVAKITLFRDVKPCWLLDILVCRRLEGFCHEAFDTIDDKVLNFILVFLL